MSWGREGGRERWERWETKLNPIDAQSGDDRQRYRSRAYGRRTETRSWLWSTPRRIGASRALCLAFSV